MEMQQNTMPEFTNINQKNGGYTIQGNPLLETKLFIPGRRAKSVSRNRLISLLEHFSSTCKLSLISAPAGFGKTTLLAEWMQGKKTSGCKTAWISLDQNDNDPGIFWTCFSSALNKVNPDIGNNALVLIQSNSNSPLKWVVTSLIHDLNTPGGNSNDEIILVLDDYHLVESEEIHDSFSLLIAHLPAWMHVVLATRTDPPLPLARLRARGELAELRGEDLRFDRSESNVFLNKVMNLNISENDIAELEARTEGWIAGLMLAAHSMIGRQDVKGFIQQFAGDNRVVIEFLTAEVLQRQPGHHQGEGEPGQQQLPVAVDHDEQGRGRRHQEAQCRSRDQLEGERLLEGRLLVRLRLLDVLVADRRHLQGREQEQGQEQDAPDGVFRGQQEARHDHRLQQVEAPDPNLEGRVDDRAPGCPLPPADHGWLGFWDAAWNRSGWGELRWAHLGWGASLRSGQCERRAPTRQVRALASAGKPRRSTGTTPWS
jgi:hypothetical protein